jgi:hypothetical protein
MPSALRALTLLALATLPALILGCGANPTGDQAEAARRRSELGELYEIYAHWSKEHGRPPRQAADVNPRQYEVLNPAGVRALRSGDYVVVWGAASTDVGTVLAYEKDAAERGGFVLLADGSVRNRSADELKAALR